ncbi:MAG TPA: TonB-dependent receptor [Thermoleophilia bacterium]|nr:TonB-dependent receptor [Thermoleophilia bacterium]
MSEYMEVTATRIPEAIEQVPASIDVISGEEIEDRGARDLHTALSLVAGVDIAPGSDVGPAGSVPELWGLKEFDAFLLVVDGVPWGGAFNPALTTLSLTDVDHIEVLRGPAPVMYGATSFVGVIQVIHRDPAAKRATLSGYLGSFGSGGGQLTAKLPAIAGFDSSLTLDGARQGYKDDRTDWSRGHLQWRNSRALGGGVFRFDVDGTLLDQDPASPRPRVGTTLSPLVPLDTNNNPAGSFINDRRLALTAGYDHPLGASMWSSMLSFSRATSDSFRGFLVDVTTDDPNAHGFRENIRLTDVYFDSHFAWTRWSRTRLVAGFDYLHGGGSGVGGDFDYFVNLDGSNPPTSAELPPAADIHIDDTRDFFGLYGQLEFQPAPRWRLEAGLRLNQTNESRTASTLDFESGELDAGSDSRNVTRPSGSLGAVWTAWERGKQSVRLWADYRYAYKPAAIDFGLDSSDEILKPETANSYEIGVKTRFLDGRGTLDLSGFLQDFDNLVIAQEEGEGLPGLTNSGKQRFKGFEASLGLRLPSHITARASYSYHDARFKDFVQDFDGVPVQLAGNQLEMSAHNMGALGLLYAPPKGLTGLLELNFVGTRFLDKRNTAPTDGYTTLSVGVGYRWRQLELRVDGRNLTDERPPVSESELGDSQYYMLPARQVTFGASYRF